MSRLNFSKVISVIIHMIPAVIVLKMGPAEFIGLYSPFNYIFLDGEKMNISPWMYVSEGFEDLTSEGTRVLDSFRIKMVLASHEQRHKASNCCERK